MVVGHREQFRLPSFEPLGFGQTLALGTVAVAARVINGDLMSAVIALVEVPAQRLQAASASGKPVLLRIDYDAGHGGIGPTQNQRDEQQADIFAFLLEQLRTGKAKLVKP